MLKLLSFHAEVYFFLQIKEKLAQVSSYSLIHAQHS